jgi:ANTAR domain
MTDFGGRTRNSVADDPAQAAPSTEETAVLPVAPDDDPVVRRTKDGWRVGGSDLPDLTSAMVLADLISAELASSAGPAGPAPADAAAVQPDRVREPAATETSRLRATIGQLEHALTARIRVEQAIGVLAERHRIQPRQAFEQLRSAARSRGRRVIDIASDVVASATNPLLQLPDELSRPRSPGRRARQPRGMLSSE